MKDGFQSLERFAILIVGLRLVAERSGQYVSEAILMAIRYDRINVHSVESLDQGLGRQALWGLRHGWSLSIVRETFMLSSCCLSENLSSYLFLVQVVSLSSYRF